MRATLGWLVVRASPLFFLVQGIYTVEFEGRPRHRAGRRGLSAELSQTELQTSCL